MLTMLLAALALQAGQAEPNAVAPLSRAGRHGVELGADLLGTTRASASFSLGGTQISASGGSFGGSLTYSYWAEDRVALQVSLGVIGADASIDIIGTGPVTEGAAVMPLLVGLKYQPWRFDAAGRVRPYVTGAVGAYIGDASGVQAGGSTTVTARTEAVLGARAGAGLDLLISRWLTLNAGVGYRLVSAFAEPIGGETNYSGTEFVLSVGVLIGSVR
jgi:outer membrane protein W